MEYEYYVQMYAKRRADSILPVPNSYPLRGDFGALFYSDLTELTELLKRIYIDVSENPAAYACELYPLNLEPRGKGADNESNSSLDRIVKWLRTLCDCGEIENNALKVGLQQYKRRIKKIKQHSAIRDRLKNFGFCYTEGTDDEYDAYFYVQYPARPTIINALKIYMDCWNDVLHDEYIKSEIKKNGYGCIAYYYDFYLLDYKATANPQQLSPIQIAKDIAYTWDGDSQCIYMDFYEYSLQYPALRFSEGSYYIGRKRVCTFRYDKKNEFIKLKLRKPSEYMTEIEKLPEHLQACFSVNTRKCWSCGCLGNDPDACTNRIYWKHDGAEYIGCSMNSFYFSDIVIDDIPYLFMLLECDYGIKKGS